MSLHARRAMRKLTLAVFVLAAIGLALVIGARLGGDGYGLSLAGVACWIVAFGVLLGHAGPHRRE